MVVLVADVGGTITRMGLAGPEFGITALRRYDNKEHRSFDEILQIYRAEEPLPDLTGACIAVAGPETGPQARQTNTGWTLEAETLQATLSAPVRLINDLAALGHALPDLTADQLHMVRPEPALSAEGRALVVGLGTGLNACQVLRLPAGSTVLEAELGMASLPGRLRAELQHVLGRASNVFLTNEDLFSGTGLSRLHRLLADGADLDGATLVAAAASDPGGLEAQTADLAGKLLGLMVRDLVYQYMPLAGIYFSGSVGRGLLEKVARNSFLEAFDQDVPFRSILDDVPLTIIADDAAGLIGAARVAAAIYRPTA